MNTINNQPNFTARLDINKLNGKRWQNIAQIFAWKTMKYPKDTFVLTPHENGDMTIHQVFPGSNINYHSKLRKRQTENLLKNSDETIDESFVRLLETVKFHHRKIQHTNKFLNAIQLDSNEKDTDFSTKIWEIVFEKYSKDIEKSLSTDPLLRVFKKNQ